VWRLQGAAQACSGPGRLLDQLDEIVFGALTQANRVSGWTASAGGHTGARPAAVMARQSSTR
jgi:hypothetical protein